LQPEDALLCSQELATGTYPETNSVVNTLKLISLGFDLILGLTSHLRLDLPTGIFPSGFPTIVD